MRPRFLKFLIAASAILAACPGSVLAQQSAEARGEALLSEHCGMCHAVGRSGTSPNSVAPPFRTLGQRYPLESLEGALGEGLITGHPAMPEFAFPPQAVGAIIRYLRSIQDR
jgi:mono/diheme cytochrome c family protein